MNIVFPIISILFCFLIFIAMQFLQKNNKKAPITEEQKKQRSIITAQEVVNVKNIEDMFLYTNDNYIISYIKVQPIATELLTEEELRNLAVELTEEFARDRQAFKFLAISKPVDIAPLINEYSELLSNSKDQIQKNLLRNEIRVITDFSLGGEVVEREFYYMLWTSVRDGAEKELRKRTNDLAKNINGAGIGATVLKRNQIIKLCNLVNNPALSSIETAEVDATIPFLKLYGGLYEEETND